MKLVPTDKSTQSESDIESVVLSTAHVDYLDRLGRQMNPDMPPAFARAHVIRTLLERFEQAGLDLSDASTEEEIARAGAAGVRNLRGA